MWFEKKAIIKLASLETKFPIEILNNVDITDLEIIGGKITYFPEDISVLKNLKRLTIVSTCISSVPKEVFELPKLTYLNLKNNKINQLPNLTHKNNLTTIILSRNKICEIKSFFINSFILLISSIANNLSIIALLSAGVIDMNDLKSLIERDIILEKI